jgi:hypothetical protein
MRIRAIMDWQGHYGIGRLGEVSFEWGDKAPKGIGVRAFDGWEQGGSTLVPVSSFHERCCASVNPFQPLFIPPPALFPPISGRPSSIARCGRVEKQYIPVSLWAFVCVCSHRNDATLPIPHYYPLHLTLQQVLLCGSERNSNYESKGRCKPSPKTLLHLSSSVLIGSFTLLPLYPLYQYPL